MTSIVQRLAACIESTTLRPEATPEQIDALCDDAVQHHLFAVCVNPIYVSHAVRRLSSAARPAPIVVSVAGFPLGASMTETKIHEAKQALDAGAAEVDMVLPIGLLLDSDHAAVRKDIAAVADAVHQFGSGRLLKVIFETAVLPDAAIIAGCRCCAEAEADFVKTSTGFHPAGGAIIDHVRLLHRHASPIRVKAAGGIRTARQALAMLDAGAARIGTSSAPQIIEEARRLPA